MIGLLVTAVVSAQNLPKRETYTIPVQMKGLAKGIEKAGVKIIYGPNSVPPPEGISEAARKMWPLLPQVPLQAHDLKKLAALRKFVNLIDDVDTGLSGRLDALGPQPLRID